MQYFANIVAYYNTFWMQCDAYNAAPKPGKLKRYIKKP